MAKYLDASGITTLVKHMKDTFYKEGDAISVSTIAASGVITATAGVEGDLTGTASNAISDAAGNNIESTYAKADDVYTKDEIDGKISSVYHYKGSVASESDLPSTDNEVGDTYNVEDTGANYSWTGDAWDKLSETIDLSNANVATADALSNAVSLITDLTKAEAVSFDGSESVDIGIKGVLPVEYGGTGSSVEKYLQLSGGTVDGDVTVNGTVDATLLMGKIANSSDDTAGSTVGSATQPVYLDSGVITATGSSLDVDITGNAATATKLAAAQTISLTGDATGSASSDGSAAAEIAVTLADTAVEAGSYGLSEDASKEHAETFVVPYITVDSKGRVTAAEDHVITLPSDTNIDTMVTQAPSTASEEHPLLATGTAALAAEETSTAVFASAITLNPGVGSITATTFKGDLNGTADVANKLGTIDVGSSITPIYLSDGDATASSETVGSSARPVYMNEGAITEVGDSLDVNAATATALQTARTITVGLDTDAADADTFDGSADATIAVSGVLTIANGGTGASTVEEALANLGIETMSDDDIADAFTAGLNATD